MSLHEITSKSILRKTKRIDSWFVASCAMNLYRGCSHNCTYCDGRAEKYQVTGDFGVDIEIKVNAPDIVRRELDPSRRRKPFPNGFVLLGGGVGDAYQPAEGRYCITRRVLETIRDVRHPVHILTKSTLVERDLDIIEEINSQRSAVVSMSFSTVDDEIARNLEPGVAPPTQRLALLEKIRRRGIHCGMYLMPLVPFVTDSPARIDRSFAQAKNHGIEFVVADGMTLKPGRQREHFYSFLRGFCPDRLHEYQIIYRDNPYGQPEGDYYASLGRLVKEVAMHHRMPLRMPSSLFAPLVNRAELAALMLDQMDYLLRMRQQDSSFRFAASQIAKSGFTPEELALLLPSVKGVGPVAKKVVREILETGSSQMYTQLMTHENFVR